MKKVIVLSVLTAVLAASVCVADYSSAGVMDGRTVELWQMDSIVRNEDSSRLEGMSGDNNLWFTLRDSAGAATTTLGALVPGKFASAISFAENAPCADATKPVVWARTRTASAWGNWPYFKLEMWVKYNDFDSLQFVAMTDSWRIWTQGSAIRFTAYFDGATSTNRQIDLAGHLDEWLYVTAIFDETGHQEFSIKNADGSFNQTVSEEYPGKVLKTTSGYITLASENGSRRSFNGAIDSLRLSRPDVKLEFESPMQDTGVGTYGLWHFDEQTSGITPDDNSKDLFGRDYPLTMTQGATLVTPSVYPAGNADFGKCLELNGEGGYVSNASFPAVNTSLFNAEFWMKMNPSILPGAAGQVTGALWLIEGGKALRVYLQVSTTGINLRFMINEVVYDLTKPISLDGGWNHYRLTFDKGTMKMYENDGVIGTLETGLTNMMAPSGIFKIGNYANNRYFWGWLDEVRIYGNTTAVCGDFGYLPADINKDCYVNIEDLKLLVANWLDCTFEGDDNCSSVN